MLLTRFGVSVVTVTLVVAVLVCYLRVANRVGSYRYCEFPIGANASSAANMWQTQSDCFFFFFYILLTRFGAGIDK